MTRPGFLVEKRQPARGRCRARTPGELVAEGRDPNYVRPAELPRLLVPFDDTGWPLKPRVPLHLGAIEAVTNLQ